MYKRNRQYKPQELDVLKVVWLEMKEQKIRETRIQKLLDESKKKGNHIPELELEERLKFPWRIQAEPLSDEERKEMQKFEKKIIIESSYGYNLENSDI